MKQISAGFKKYNANTSDKSVGDCVKRALSYAYSADYDEISRELNRINREIGGGGFNYRRVYTRFLDIHDAQKLSTSDLLYTPEGEDSERPMTEAEFCTVHPDGTYVLLTGPANKTYTTHMVCIMNGDIIDSWDSSNYVVRQGWKIPNASNLVFEVTWHDVIQELYEYIDQYLETVNKKADGWFKAWRGEGYGVNDQTYKMPFYVKIGGLPGIHKDSAYYANETYMKRIVVKINPRFSIDQNVESLKSKLKERVYNFIYPFQKDKKDTEAIQDMEIHPRMYNDAFSKKDLLKLPAWCRKYVTYFWVNPNPNNGLINYEIHMDSLPEDYRKEEYPTLSLSSDTLAELKDMLERYRLNFDRPGRDY